MQERNALVSLSAQQAGPHTWLYFADIQDVSPSHGRGSAGLYVPSTREEASTGAANMTQLQTDR